MGRMYSAAISGVASGVAAFDFFELAPAANKPIAIHAVHIHQSSDYGDAAAEGLRWSIRRGGTAMTSGSGGTTATPVRVNSSADTASGITTVEVMNTTVATFTSGVIVHDDAFNVQIGIDMVWTPETRPQCSNANGGIVVRCESAPADAITFSGTIYFEELI